MAKNELFRGFSRIFVDAGNEASKVRNEIYSGFSRIFIDDDKGAETEITIRSDVDEDASEEEAQVVTTEGGEEGSVNIVDVEEDPGDAEDETVIEQTVVTITSTTPPQLEPEPEEGPASMTGQQLPQMATTLEQMSERLKSIESAVSDTQHKDDLIRNLHKEMEGLKNDFYASLRRPLIKSIVAIHRRMNERLKYLEMKMEEEGADSKALLDEAIRNMEFDCTTVLDTLEDEHDLVYFEPTAGEAYNPKEENAVQVVETDNPVLGGTVKDIIYGGFKESSTGRVWLKANIAVYRMKK